MPVREQDMNTQEMIVTHSQPEYSDGALFTLFTATRANTIAPRA